MISTFILAFALQTAAGGATVACSGPHPAITSVNVKGVTESAGLNNFEIAATVTNDGTAPMAKDTLLFVDMYTSTGEKLDAKGIQPMGPGGSQTVTYVFQRSRDAGNGTTKLRFALDQRQPAATQGCATASDSFPLTF